MCTTGHGDNGLPGEEREKNKREQALRGVIAALRSLNRELKDFTGEIPGASAMPAAISAERPPLSVTCWSAAACEGFKLSKVSPVPDPRLARYSRQSVILSPGASLSCRVNARAVLSEEKSGIWADATRPEAPTGSATKLEKKSPQELINVHTSDATRVFYPS